MTTVTNQTLSLASTPSIAQFQEYVRKLKVARNFKNNKQQAIILLFKEIGELAQVTRKVWHDEKAITPEIKNEIALEMADVMIYFLDLANQYDVDLEDAFRRKEEINKKRDWPAYYHY